MAKRKKPEIVKERIVRAFFYEVRCEKCLGKPARCPKCEREVQTFTKAVIG